MMSAQPRVVVLAGPNGAGKSTAASKLLLGPLQVTEFVNADTIALGLSAFSPERVAFEAGRTMLKRIKDLAKARADFAFETTLATRSYAPWLKQMQSEDYQVHVLFLWLPSADTAVARVAERVRAGGHHVPEATIRRRYARGLTNLRSLYLPLADSWTLVDNTGAAQPVVIASGEVGDPPEIYDETAWKLIAGIET